MFFNSANPNVLSGCYTTAELYMIKQASDLCNNAFISVNRNWVVTYWNKGAERMFKTKAEEVIGKNVWDKFYTIIPVEFYGFYDRVFLVGASYQFSYFWAEINAWIEICTFSEQDGFSVSMQTHFTPGEEEAFNQSRFLYPIYRFITESKQECLWNWKIDSGERFWIDGGLKKLFGYNIENTFLPHAFWENRIHPDDLEMVKTNIELFVQSDQHDWTLHYRFRKADGKYIAIYETGLKFYNQENKTEEVIGAMYEEGPHLHVGEKDNGLRTQRQKEIAGAILTAQETERYEIGYKLNEDLSQILAIAKVYIQLSSSSPVSGTVYLQKANSLIDLVINGIRNITEEILLPSSNLMGLFQNLEHLCKNSHSLNNLTTRFTHSGIKQEELDEAFQYAIFRIIQEQIRLIAAFKTGGKVHIDLRRKGKKIILLITDDRQQIDFEVEKRKGAYTNIQSRADIFNGVASFYPGNENNCILEVIFPVPKGRNTEVVQSS